MEPWLPSLLHFRSADALGRSDKRTNWHEQEDVRRLGFETKPRCLHHGVYLFLENTAVRIRECPFTVEIGVVPCR